MAAERPWYERARKRACDAFNASVGTGDRGAMLRELCRLHGGYLDCVTSGAEIRPEDMDSLARFGLKRIAAAGGSAIIIDNVLDSLPIDGLIDVLRLDPTLRQIYPAASADALLLRHSPFDHYRTPTQKAAIRALATMPDASTLLATLPTGAGKSLLFQLVPALAQEPGACCVVIVPTVALALAHVGSLRMIAGLEASACVHGGQSAETRKTVYDSFARGEVPVLVLSPEVALS
ncbi:DEAD/DEAH box helicase, partial [Mesorhizobium sp. M4B.F.Ca.ET.089.01.1.1]|uniref:DEAD/DEAH box helicase n=1 Tax=Mesorhizobium sp. M4B.F.Ca.ET.089.01.1.1 TaxID=2496662 RepID=UPI001674D9EC